MTLDSSAIIAILLDEPEKEELLAHIVLAKKVLVSSVTVLESAMVLGNRKGPLLTLGMDHFLQRIRAKIIPFDETQLGIARTAAKQFGKGRHPAALNFGDCASYALSQWSGEPLLYKGNDFTLTDVLRVRS